MITDYGESPNNTLPWITPSKDLLFNELKEGFEELDFYYDFTLRSNPYYFIFNNLLGETKVKEIMTFKRQ